MVVKCPLSISSFLFVLCHVTSHVRCHVALVMWHVMWHVKYVSYKTFIWVIFKVAIPFSHGFIHGTLIHQPWTLNVSKLGKYMVYFCKKNLGRGGSPKSLSRTEPLVLLTNFTYCDKHKYNIYKTNKMHGSIFSEVLGGNYWYPGICSETDARFHPATTY